MLKKIVSGTVLVLLVIIIITLPCNIQPVKAAPSNVIATYGEGYLENVNGALVLHVEGSPYEMGYQHGFLLKDWVPVVIQARIQRMISMGYSYDYLVNCAQAMLPHIPQEYIEEMEGLAAGASVNYTGVLLAQIVDDIECYGHNWTGCNGFVVFGNATMDGHLYHGRSLDSYVPPGESAGLITVYEPDSGTAFVNVGFIGIIGVYTGMNKEGITLELNISSSNDTTLVGTPILFTSRKVLQYSNNLTEAFDIMSQTDRTTGWNVLLGDGKNLNACAIEISAHHCKLFWAGDQAENMPPYYYPIQDAVLRTNQYVDPTLAATQRSPYDPTIISSLPNVPNWSWVRYAALRQWIEDNYGNITAEMSIGLLKTPPIACKGSLQSMVFGSTNLELWVANAANNTPAYAREFIYLSYDDLFPEVDLTITSTEGGNVTTPGEGTFTYDAGTVVSLNATPDASYRFVNWTGDVGTIAEVSDASTTITMNGNYGITADFEAAPPSVSTQAASAANTTSVTLNMNYTVGNFGQVQVRFAYKKSADSAWSSTDWVSKAADGTYATSLAGLDSSTQYDFKAQLKYNDTVIEGTTTQFTIATPTSAGWCFIATAAYGTPMAEQIQILREFRDKYLLTNPVGQTLVGLYYRVSPPIAEFITEHPSLKPMVRAGLVPVVVMSTIAVNTTPAEKAVIMGLLMLVSVALAVWATRRRGGGPQYT